MLTTTPAPAPELNPTNSIQKLVKPHEYIIMTPPIATPTMSMVSFLVMDFNQVSLIKVLDLG
jgi:hypothetical protein